jgi:hypothetical protein
MLGFIEVFYPIKRLRFVWMEVAALTRADDESTLTSASSMLVAEFQQIDVRSVRCARRSDEREGTPRTAGGTPSSPLISAPMRYLIARSTIAPLFPRLT